MKCSLVRIAFYWTLAVPVATGQTGLSGPSLGFVYDGDAQAIRPILGVPGSATIGAPLDLGGNAVVLAAISPQQNYVLAFLANSTLALVHTRNGAITVEPHPEVTQVPDVIGISPSGASAALFSRQNASIQVLTGLPDSLTTAAGGVDVSLLPNSLDTLTITDDGSSILAGFPENTTPGSQSGEVYLIPADGSAPRSLVQLAHASALQLSKQSGDLLVADDAGNTVYRVSDVRGAAAVSVVPGGTPQVEAPTGVIASPDDQMLFVAGLSGAISITDAAGQNAVAVQCSCSPTELRRLSGGNAYQLTELADGVVWMLYWDPNNPRTLFIPSAWSAPALTGAVLGTGARSR